MSKECRTPALDTPERALFPLWIQYAREEYARPIIVEALDTAMQLVVTTYADDLEDDINADPAMLRFVAMRQAVHDRAVAEGLTRRLTGDLEIAERVLRLIRRGLPA